MRTCKIATELFLRWVTLYNYKGVEAGIMN